MLDVKVKEVDWGCGGMSDGWARMPDRWWRWRKSRRSYFSIEKR
jgi:hypothetical protein